MAILFITHKFPPSIGGMQRQSYQLINGIRQFEKTVCIIQSPGESKFVFFLSLLWRIRNFIKKYPEINLIHCNDGVAASFCAVFRRWIDLPITATFHGLDIVFPNQIFQLLIVPQLRQLDIIFPVSEATAQECLKRGFRPEQLKVIRNGVDMEISKIKPNVNFVEEFYKEYNIDLRQKKVLISIGRAVKRKGFSWFIKSVFPNLPMDTIYIVIGPISSPSSFLSRILKILPASLKNQIELFLGYPSDGATLQRGVDQQDGCFHLGKIPYNHMIQLLLKASLLVMPNKRVEGDMEGFGLVALEANLAGTFVVAADLEGIRCAVKEGKNGTLLTPEDAGEWIDKIRLLLSQPMRLKSKSDQAKKFVQQHFSWELMTDKYLSEFRALSYNQNVLKYQFAGLRS